MKKTCVLVIVFLFLLASSIVLAADNETISNDDSSSTKIDAAYSCLEEKAADCTTLTTQELALTIMATPDNIFDKCVEELEKRESSDNWGNVLDTSFAIIAMKHAGKDTELAEEWLMAQNKTPTDLIWYLQEDSNEATECHIGYDANDYKIKINEDKKIDKNAGTCLKRAQANFWLEISNNCHDKKFQIECDKDFVANLIYRNKNSPTIYVLEGTSSAPALGSIELQLKSKCFGDSTCEYESTLWAALALMDTGHNVDEYIPYIIAMSETNKRYLPSAFIYILTNYEGYANSLISEQKLGNYWEATSSAYNKYYDTGLALLGLSSTSSAEQITNAKKWLLFSQGSNGCWQNSIRETAMVLWALEGKADKSSSSSSPGSSITYCSDASYFCIPSSECNSSDDVGDNYACHSQSDTCCMKQNLKSCSEYSGEECAAEEVCTGDSRRATDTNDCCIGNCEARVQETECVTNSYTCMDSCADFQEPIPAYSCDSGQVCCKTKTEKQSSGLTWWIWLLIILILITLGAIGYIYREQLKLYWFQLKIKFKKDDGKTSGSSSGPRRPGIPPRPGFPPVRRPRSPVPTQQRFAQPTRGAPPRTRYPERRDKAMSDTFQKLRDMSK